MLLVQAVTSGFWIHLPYQGHSILCCLWLSNGLSTSQVPAVRRILHHKLETHIKQQILYNECILSISIIAFLNNNCFLSGTATHVLFQLYIAHVHTYCSDVRGCWREQKRAGESHPLICELIYCISLNRCHDC